MTHLPTSFSYARVLSHQQGLVLQGFAPYVPPQQSHFTPPNLLRSSLHSKDLESLFFWQSRQAQLLECWTDHICTTLPQFTNADWILSDANWLFVPIYLLGSSQVPRQASLVNAYWQSYMVYTATLIMVITFIC